MVIYNDRATLGLNESTMIRGSKSRTKICPMQQYELDALKESQEMFESLIECDFTEAAMNANLITEAVGTVLLEEQNENIFQKFWNWLRGIWDKFCEAIKGLWEKIVNFFKGKTVKGDGKWSSEQIVKAFKEGNLANVKFSRYIGWNVEAFESMTSDKFMKTFKELTGNLEAKFNKFADDKRAASTETYYYNLLPITEGKNASVSNLNQVMESVLVKEKGEKQGLTDQEKQNLIKFYNNNTKYSDEFRKIENLYNKSYSSLKAVSDKFIQSRSGGLKNAVKEFSTRKIKFVSSMVAAYNQAITRYLNTYSGFLTRAATSTLTTIESGGRAILKAEAGETSGNKKEEPKKNDRKQNKDDKKKDKDKVNESFIFDESMGIEEAIDYLSEAEDEYYDLMAVEFAG